jgi:hypothetical protein
MTIKFTNTSEDPLIIIDRLISEFSERVSIVDVLVNRVTQFYEELISDKIKAKIKNNRAIRRKKSSIMVYYHKLFTDATLKCNDVSLKFAVNTAVMDYFTYIRNVLSFFQNEEYAALNYSLAELREAKEEFHVNYIIVNHNIAEKTKNCKKFLNNAKKYIIDENAKIHIIEASRILLEMGAVPAPITPQL